MEAKSSTFGCWDTFGTYLRTHPANPNQLHSRLDDISWIMVVRLMRNIFCHEHYIDWRSLLELKKFSVAFFGSLEKVQECLECYLDNCEGSKAMNTRITLSGKRRNSSAALPVADIQLVNPDRFCVLNAKLTVKPTASMWNALHRIQDKPALICGPPHSGKTRLLQHLLVPFIFTKRRNRLDDTVFISCEHFSGGHSDLLARILNEIGIFPSASPGASLQRLRDVLGHKRILITLDDVQWLLLAWGTDLFQDFIGEIANFGMFATWIFSVSQLGESYMRRNCPEIFSYLDRIEVPSGEANAKLLKDTELLCRHYVGVNKWYFKEALNVLPGEFQYESCLISLAETLSIQDFNYTEQTNKFIHSIISKVSKEASNYPNSFLSFFINRAGRSKHYSLTLMGIRAEETIY